jgi:hypothetical protein
MLGHWQNKGWKTEDPKEIALAATKQARELERHFGVPADQLLRMPKADAKPEDWKAFHQRLGAPADPKEYDLSGIKYAGEDLEPAFVDSMRAALHAVGVPKDKAAALIAPVVSYLENADKAEATVTAGKIAAEKAELAKDWGEKFQYNHLKAMEGAARLGITPEAIKALEGQVGYKAVMESMRRVGVGTTEDSFVEGSAPGGPGVTTATGAQARMAELIADTAWGKRFTAGDATAKAEWEALTRMMSPE